MYIRKTYAILQRMEQENNIFLTVTEDIEPKTRLDKFLSVQLQISRAAAQRLIKTGHITSNGSKTDDCDHIVFTGEHLQIEKEKPIEAIPKPQDIQLDIVFEDDDLIVINKPAGIVVHPGAGVHEDTIVNAVLYHAKGTLSGIGGVLRPGIVHRIDKETSGLIVVAKNDNAHLKLSEQFAVHSIDRTYKAFVYGVLNPLQGTIEGNIGRSKYDRKKMALLTSSGKPAVTHYQTLEIFQNAASLVSCKLETGRTHQIRVHLSSLGCHLIGDKVYKENHISSLKIPSELKHFLLSFPRQALHAETLGFIHPRTNKKMFFETPFPPDLQELYQKLHTW